jgi:hypothetical protein
MATNKTVLSVALSGRVTASVADPYAGHGSLENLGDFVSLRSRFGTSG